jgi:hypothetical protein
MAPCCSWFSAICAATCGWQQSSGRGTYTLMSARCWGLRVSGCNACWWKSRAVLFAVLDLPPACSREAEKQHMPGASYSYIMLYYVMLCYVMFVYVSSRHATTASARTCAHMSSGGGCSLRFSRLMLQVMQQQQQV